MSKFSKDHPTYQKDQAIRLLIELWLLHVQRDKPEDVVAIVASTNYNINTVIFSVKQLSVE